MLLSDYFYRKQEQDLTCIHIKKKFNLRKDDPL